MTHKDIYTKFMIEYDKANVTSSYPSLTEYEVATLLDKAYQALIAQKLTGNNYRQAPFEADIKAIADLQPLLVQSTVTFEGDTNAPAMNVSRFKLPSDCMYFVQLLLLHKLNDNDLDKLNESKVYKDDIQYEEEDPDAWVTFEDVYGDKKKVSVNGPYDNKSFRLLPTKLVPHPIAERFFITPYNMPWIKNPVCYINDDTVSVVYDLLNKPRVDKGQTAKLKYIKQPKKFLIDTEDTTVNWFRLDISRLNSNDKLGQ